MYDFLRFVPENLMDLGFKSYIFMLEKPGICGGVVVKAENPDDLRKKLRKVRKNIIVGVTGNEAVCREAVMRRKVDLILDSDNRQLDYATIKLAAEKDVAIELSLAKFIRNKGLSRMQLFERLCDEVRVIKKFDVPFVVTTAAENVYEMRTRRQVENFFSFFGCEIVKARQHATRLVRKYYDTRFIMDGFEIEAELEADVKKKG
ncbi:MULTISPECIES: RNase P subunit p30 family protein [unclassified Archaeoglobus]|jgi:ribonuclease P/MRP protein subunit RPP1|uniref:RNase P subunit p30 family protein n=1 Tax=unclassified Archaeoglobus TaxID=2643606 RepID=UPI0025BFD2BA|nr:MULTISPECIES: RNase P subunit p30 family protein [unclassified Archaeoglobus]